jgi:hypothetical protein
LVLLKIQTGESFQERPSRQGSRAAKSRGGKSVTYDDFDSDQQNRSHRQQQQKPSVSFDPHPITAHPLPIDSGSRSSSAVEERREQPIDFFPENHAGDMGHLTDRWLEELSISSRIPLIDSLRQEIAGNGRVSECVESGNTRGFGKNLKNNLNKTTPEDVRLAVAALETKTVWRYLQKAANDASHDTCRQAKNEWNAFGSGSQNSFYNGENTGVPESQHYGKCYFDTSDILDQPQSVTSGLSNDTMQGGSSSPTTLSDGIEFCVRWQNFRQLVLQTVIIISIFLLKNCDVFVCVYL